MATTRAPRFIHFKNHGFLQTQEVSSPSSDSCSDSSPGGTYVPLSDWEWQRNYSGREVESHVNADTYRCRFVPTRNLQIQEVSSPSSDSSSDSSPGVTYVPPSDQGWQRNCSGREVESRVSVDTYRCRFVPTRNLQIQEISSPSSDSSSDSSPGATYVPPSDQGWQRNYSGREVESRVNADTYRRRFVPARNHRFLQIQEVSSPSSDSSSDWIAGATYVPPSDREWQRNYLGREVESHVIADTYTPSLDLERLRIYSDIDIESHVNAHDTYAPPSDLGLQWDYSDTENEVYANVAKGKWIKHYNSNHRILLVGEGDFSFSASLAVAFGSAPNIIATSLDSEDFLKTNYMHAMSNVEKLRSRECLVMHGIDATEVATHHLLGGMTFDRIIFNFPFAGFFKKYLSRVGQLIMHRTLVSLFLENAKEMIGENGEIHISHKINGFHKEWNLEELASSHGLGLIEAVEFNQSDYEGYNTKYGFGGDNNFNCDPSKTYKFGIKRQQVQLFS